MQSDSNKGDTELQLLRKQMADEKMKKEQVKKHFRRHYIRHFAWSRIHPHLSVCLLTC